MKIAHFWGNLPILVIFAILPKKTLAPKKGVNIKSCFVFVDISMVWHISCNFAKIIGSLELNLPPHPGKSKFGLFWKIWPILANLDYFQIFFQIQVGGEGK